MVKRYRCIIINTYFEKEDLTNNSVIKEDSHYIKTTCDLINENVKDLELSGLLFVHSAPKYAGHFSVFLNNLEIQEGEKSYCLFKYDLCLENKNIGICNVLNNANLSMLMYLKTKSLEHPSKFYLDTKTNRVKYLLCAACNQNSVDWGGKKHLMNQLGSALSDVWSDLDYGSSNINKIPSKGIDRIMKLMKLKPTQIKIVEQDKIRRDI